MNFTEELRAEYNKLAVNPTDAADLQIGAEELYCLDILDSIGSGENRHALDVGAGTGSFTKIMLQCGYSMKGVDFADDLLQLARAEMPDIDFQTVNDIENSPNAYQANEFDLIISRQVVCHFVNPIATFRQWKDWLKPNGRVAVVDGLWSRSGWSNEFQKFPDYLPLSCTQTWATVSYLLEQAGFRISCKNWLNRVNGYEAVQNIGSCKSSRVRYIVIGEKLP